MRKITQQAVNALFEGVLYRNGNTEITHSLDGAKMWLHGNLIAVLNSDEVTLYTCGWKTTTTKERLNGVVRQYGFNISQKAGKWFVNNYE
jgi:hypothetical protein